MPNTIYENYNQGEEAKFAQMSQDSLQGIAQNQAQNVIARQKQDSQQGYDQVSTGRNVQRGMESIMNATNPMALSPEQLIAVKAMNQRNNAKYLFDISKKSREGGNVADSQKYAQFAKQFTKNAASLDKDALMTRREILADDSILLKGVRDQQSLNNVVALAELRGRPMTELLSMTEDGLYSDKTKNYIDSRLGQLGQERDWLDTNMQVLDDETRYYDRVADDKRATAYERVLARKEALLQQNLANEDRNRQRQEEKTRAVSLRGTPQSYEDLIRQQKAALRNTLSDKQLENLDKVNPELAAIERNRKNELSDPSKYAASRGYDLNQDTQSLRRLSERARDAVKALPSPEVLLQEWRAAKKKAPSEDELDLMKWHKDPMYDVYKAQADQVDTIDTFVQNKYGVPLTQESMKEPHDRVVYTDEHGQDITPKDLIDTATKHRMSIDQVLLNLGVPWKEREMILSKYPDLKV